MEIVYICSILLLLSLSIVNALHIFCCLQCFMLSHENVFHFLRHSSHHVFHYIITLLVIGRVKLILVLLCRIMRCQKHKSEMLVTAYNPSGKYVSVSLGSKTFFRREGGWDLEEGSDHFRPLTFPSLSSILLLMLKKVILFNVAITPIFSKTGS